MQFITMTVEISDPDWEEKLTEQGSSVAARRSFSAGLRRKVEQFNREHQKDGIIFPVSMEEDGAELRLLLLNPAMGEALGRALLEKLHIRGSVRECAEITREEYLDGASHAVRERYIGSETDTCGGIPLDILARSRFSPSAEESILEELSEEEIRSGVIAQLAEEAFLPELDRIYRGSARGKYKGHPVHYLLQTSDRESRKQLCRLLLSALYANCRIENKRYTFVNISPAAEGISPMWCDTLYRSCAGGALLLRFTDLDSEESEFGTRGIDLVEMLCSAMKKYRNEVLTVLCLPRESTTEWEMLREHLDTVSFVELRENLSDRKEAADYLVRLAAEQKLEPDSTLFSGLLEDGKYLPRELHRIFDVWQSDKLKREIYPQYAEIETVRAERKKESPIGDAYEELKSMIGLGEAKQVMDDALSYFKAQKLYATRGLKMERPAMHMVFTGNPGTAKTTVARLFARVLRDNGVLSTGRFIECGRGDLVGKYVGWTAPTIQKKFKEAKGGVLFIDEAYSLVDDRSGSFGDEAINTIVQEMENHRKDVLVIFAGYPDKMEGFLQKNPGLRSRIAFHVPFADYTAEELCDITALHAKKQGFRLETDARDALREVYREALKQPDFGNGRFARNVLEKACMAQAARLLQTEENDLTADALVTLTGEDFMRQLRLPTEASRANADPVFPSPMRRIGF